jgi:Tol biopolymer transport system component/uncharacterized RDD family membrane protein YckC
MSGVPEPPSQPPESAPRSQEDVLGRRISAALIDLALVVGLFVVLALAIGESKVEDGSVSLNLNGADAGLYFALVFLYYFVLEAALGQTVGKLLLGLRVFRLDGSQPSVFAIAVRTLLRIVDWLPLLYLVGFITMMATGRRRQRLGDLAAKTSLARAPMRHRSLALGSLALLLLAIVGLSAYRAADSDAGTTNTSRADAAQTIQAADGTIAFATTRGCHDNPNDYRSLVIFLMNGDGSGQTRLTPNTSSAFEGSPAWSPNGRKIAFTRSPNNSADYEIFVMNAGGSGRTNLTHSPGQNFYPTWAPDGKKIAFESWGDVFVMNADGSGQKNLTSDPASDSYSPAWSPDGTRIAFASNAGPGENDDRDIFVMNADGSDQTNLTSSPPSEDDEPAWSPDGKRIVFTRGSEPEREIFVMNADGSDPTNLTNTPDEDDLQPAWSPDGTKIAFSNGDPNGDIIVMNADGSGRTNLTNTPDEGDYAPAWRPLPPSPPPPPLPPQSPQQRACR